MLIITEDDSMAVRKFYDEIGDENDEAEIEAKFGLWLEDYHCQDWQRDSIRDAFMIERDCSGHYIPVPKQDSRAGYDDMVDFTETVTDERLQKRLFAALHGKGPFRRFKDVLYDYPEEKERFFKFSEDSLRNRIVEWLEDEDIELEK